MGYPLVWRAIGRLDAETTNLLFLTCLSTESPTERKTAQKQAFIDNYEVLIIAYHKNESAILDKFRTVGGGWWTLQPYVVV
jgi:hypothetical protein